MWPVSKWESTPGIFAGINHRLAEYHKDFFYEPIIKNLSAEGSFKNGIDLGSGTGQLSIGLAKQYPKSSIVGVDLSRRIVNKARKNAFEAGLSDRLIFLKENANSLLFTDAYFDFAFSTCLLHRLNNPSRVFCETYRLLLPSGKAIFYDLKAEAAQETLREFIDLWLTPLSPTLKRLLKPFAYRKFKKYTYSSPKIQQEISKSPFGNFSVEDFPIKGLDIFMKITLSKP